MIRCPTLRRHVVRRPAWWRLFVQRSVIASYVVLACTPPTRYEQPSALRGYEILITRRDSLGEEIAAGLEHRGFTVRRHVRGGGRPTAFLLAFTFRDPEPPAVTWIHVRLADTRTGAIVAAMSAPLDSLGATTLDHARSIVDSLAASPP
ncbi:MAG: hypothetical protein DMD25_12520 [Gemmatimonadetes bacterium]|nr:MAG: hypothetical protein DMD25_12520 [Gemmatimonadota bacterium]